MGSFKYSAKKSKVCSLYLFPVVNFCQKFLKNIPLHIITYILHTFTLIYSSFPDKHGWLFAQEKNILKKKHKDTHA